MLRNGCCACDPARVVRASSHVCHARLPRPRSPLNTHTHVKSSQALGGAWMLILTVHRHGGPQGELGAAACTETRRYIRYSVSGYSNDTARVYKYIRYSSIGVSGADSADTANTAAIQQRTAAIQQRYSRIQQKQLIRAAAASAMPTSFFACSPSARRRLVDACAARAASGASRARRADELGILPRAASSAASIAATRRAPSRRWHACARPATRDP
eukprot:1075344-Prymnesium_polylepis.1